MTYMFSGANYVSPPSSPGLLVRLFPALTFYGRTLWVICSSTRSAEAGTYTSEDWVQDSQDVARAAEFVGGHIEMEGLDIIHQLNEPCVFVGNHMSTLETFVLPAVIQPWRPVTFVIKHSLQTYPMFGPILRSRDPIVIGRTNPREDLTTVLEQGEDRLRRGISVVVFPQSTRAPGFDRAKFNSIGVKLAKRAGVPVVPFALRTDFWANGKLFKDFGHVRPDLPIRLRFGTPLHITSTGKAEHTAVCEFVASALTSWNVPELTNRDEK